MLILFLYGQSVSCEQNMMDANDPSHRLQLFYLHTIVSFQLPALQHFLHIEASCNSNALLTLPFHVG
jgi:hypothetical protein